MGHYVCHERGLLHRPSTLRYSIIRCFWEFSASANEMPGVSRYRGGKKLHVRIDKDLRGILLELAAAERRSVASLCNLVLRDFAKPEKSKQ